MSGYRRKTQVTLIDWIKSHLQAREDEESESEEREEEGKYHN